MAYVSLSTANLPDPAIDNAVGQEASDHFNTALYTGNASSRSLDMGHATDWVWLKMRDGTDSHVLADSVRGADEFLSSNNTNAKNTANGCVTAFNSNGFSLGSQGIVNDNGKSFVAWSWNMGGSTVSGTATGGGGSRAYSYRASTKAGLSVLAYTGDGTDGGEVPHGLSGGVDAVFIKRRNSSLDWHCFYASGLLTGESYFLSLNKTDGQSTTSYGTADLNDSGTALTLKAGGNGSRNVNASSDTYVAYIFKSVEGFSKIGSYEGTNAAGGPFVYLGFRPALVILKLADSSSNGFFMFDNKRDTHNELDDYLLANDNGAEINQAARAVDFYSNGFKLQTDAEFDPNASGTFVYMAFAEQPFKFANAR